jgi:hypothetical protein
MKCAVFVALFTLLSAQLTTSQGISGNDPYAEQIVREALSLHGVSLSFTEKAVNRLGDRAAVALIRILADTPPAQPEQVTAILSLLHDAFAAPGMISDDADLQPKATLFLLECLRHLPSAQSLGVQVKQTKAFVLASAKRNRP